MVSHIIQSIQANRCHSRYPHAAKMEGKGKVLLGMGVEKQAMVIIKRQRKAKAKTNKKKDEEKKLLKPK